MPGSGFGPSGPPGPARSAGKFCGRHRERREGREGKQSERRVQERPPGNFPGLRGTGTRRGREPPHPPVRVPSAHALGPGARPAARTSRRGPRQSQLSKSVAGPSTPVPEGKRFRGEKQIPGFWLASVSSWASCGPPLLTFPGLRA